MTSVDAYIIIANPLKEGNRIQRLEKHLLERGIPKDKIHYCAPTWSDTLTVDQIFKHYDPYAVRPTTCFTYKGRCLTKGEISLVLNFWAAAELAISLGTQRAVIFESDVMLREDFIKRLDSALEKFSDWEYVSLSDGVGTHIPNINPSPFKESALYPAPHQFCFRTTDSMLFKTDYLRRIRQTAFPFRECLDWELNFQNMINRGKAYWIEPHIVEQQTLKSILSSSLAG